MPKSKARFALTPALLLSLVACGQQKLPDFSAHPGGQAVGGATTETTQPASTAPSQVAAQTVPGTSFAQRVFDLTNAARTQARTCGTTAYAAAPALTYNSLLERAAQDHAADMASKNYFSHTSLDGRKFSQRITNAGYGWRTAGENIAAGYDTPEALVQGWLQSPGHCANIMNPAFKEIGVGYSYGAASSYGHYWGQDFGAGW